MSRNLNEINAGSMADIAFLLLIFFLVTTTMDIETGIVRILPHIPDGPIPPYKERNVFILLVNKNNKIMVEEKETDIADLKFLIKEFMLNPTDNKNLSEKKVKDIPGIGKILVSKGIISLKNDRGTNYKTYISIQNELASAFSELRNEFSLRHFTMDYDHLSDTEKIKAVQNAIPLSISEAEPENIGGN